MMLLTGPILAQPEDPLASYLKEKQQAQPLDLDAYLREKRVAAQANGMGPGAAFGHGVAQGGTLGWGDEAVGASEAARKQIERMPELRGIPDAQLYATAMGAPEDYTQARDAARETNEAARRSHKGLYMAGEVVGGALPSAAASMVTGGASMLPMTVAQGTAQGAGYSDADSAGGLALDSAVGGAFGAAGHEMGQAAGGILRGLAGLAKSKAAAAAGRASTQATEEAHGALGSLSGQYRSEVQKGSRYIENLMRLHEAMTPQQRALYAQLEQSGVVPNLQQMVAQSTLEHLPDQAATIAARKAEVEAARHALPQTIAARTDDLLKPQFGKDAASLAKSYAEPVIAAAIAPPGMKEAAGLIFGRTRAGKAIATRIMRPGNQKAIWDAVEGGAHAPLAGGDVGTFLRRAIQAAAAQQSTQAALGQ